MQGAANGKPLAFKVSFHEKSPPVVIVAIAKLLGLQLDLVADPKLAANAPPTLHISNR